MKNVIVTLSFLMVFVLIIGTYMYEKQPSIKLPEPIYPKEQVKQQPNILHPVNDDTISYSLQNDELNITYNKGNDWIEVPIDKEVLFEGEYQGSEDELITGSYILSKDYTAFLYSEDADTAAMDAGEKKIMLTYSLDQGKTWQESVVTDSFAPIRFRKVAFLNEDFGYVIISGDRTMSQEYVATYLTDDGGITWDAAADPPSTRLIAFGGFVDELTGFLSYGTINPKAPEMYTTQDGGDHWEESEFHMPEQYKPVFVQAETPVKQKDHLSVLVNQGPNGDYEGGKVKGEFISEDNGLTWDFSMEVNPDETE